MNVEQMSNRELTEYHCGCCENKACKSISARNAASFLLEQNVWPKGIIGESYRKPLYFNKKDSAYMKFLKVLYDNYWDLDFYSQFKSFQDCLKGICKMIGVKPAAIKYDALRDAGLVCENMLGGDTRLIKFPLLNCHGLRLVKEVFKIN